MDEKKDFMLIDTRSREEYQEAHYACTAASGSSCQGALLKEDRDFNPIDVVQKYYGKELKSTSDLKTSACCTPDSYH